MRIAWYSNAPWAPTGYGTQTAQVLKRLKAAGHDVAVVANYGLFGTTLHWDGDIPVFPQGTDLHSNDIAPAHAAFWLGDEPGWVITLYDVWVLGREAWRGANVASWTPIDHMPVPPQVLGWAQEHPTIAMSQFGQRALAQAGVDANYIPHAIETDIFRPTPSDSRSGLKLCIDGKQRDGIPDDAFLVMINAANKGGTPPRKAWAPMLSAFAIFAGQHPNAYLYLHTDLDGMAGAPNLRRLSEAVNLDPARVRVVPQYHYRAAQIPDTTLAQIYSAADVLLMTSMGEGFGVPAIEAQACGLPIIVTNFSAQAELVGPGWAVGYEPYHDQYMDSFLALPHISQIVKALELALERKGDADLRAECVTFASQYDADLVFDKFWVPQLAKLEEQLKPPTRQQRRATKRAKR